MIYDSSKFLTNILSARTQRILENERKRHNDYDFTCVYAVGADARIHILYHSANIPDCLSEDIEVIESETCDTNSAPGIYKGSFRWDSEIDRETGIDEGCFIISEDSELLYELPLEYWEN